MKSTLFPRLLVIITLSLLAAQAVQALTVQEILQGYDNPTKGPELVEGRGQVLAAATPAFVQGAGNVVNNAATSA